VFYDRRGNIAATFAPNGLVMQSRYDGVGRLTTSFTLGNVPAANWATATALTASVNVGTNGGLSYVRPGTAPARSDTAVVTTYTYDAAGRVQAVTDPRGIVASRRASR
jgi:YD repeat-containing protein